MPEICNEDLQVNFSQVIVPPDAVYGGDQGIDTVKIVPTKATKSQANSKLICTTAIVCTFATATPCPFSSATYNFISGAANISATATKVACDSSAVLLNGDTGSCAGQWTLKASPFTPLACSCNLSISNAGQTKVLGV